VEKKVFLRIGETLSKLAMQDFQLNSSFLENQKEFGLQVNSNELNSNKKTSSNISIF